MIMNYYGSVRVALSTVYPEYDWKVWKFERVHKWNDICNQREYLDWISGDQLNIQTAPDDWYSLATESINQSIFQEVQSTIGYSKKLIVLYIFSIGLFWMLWR